MIKGAIATIILILILTGWTLRRRGDRDVKAKWVIPLWGGGGAFVVFLAVAIWWVSATRDYDACASRVDRSIGNRAQTLQLFNTIDAATGTTHYTHDSLITGQPSLRDALDINLPALTLASCDPLKP